MFGFHAQQAAGKLLKAWLDHIGHQYPLTHSLAVLSERLRILGADVTEADQVVEYAPYAYNYRYGGAPEDEAIDRPLALQRLERLLACVRQALSQPSPPAAPD